MSRKQLSMRKIEEVVRLQASGLSVREIARSCNLARSTVADYLRRLASQGWGWPLPPELTQADLEAHLFEQAQRRGRDLGRPVPEWPHVLKELRRKAVTLRLLWEEYRQIYPEGYGYSQYCELYGRWAKTLDVCLRQTYPGGERLFVDYAGMTVPIRDPAGGETWEAQIFVAAMGASHYLFTEATRTQQLPDWIGSHIRAFEHFGGVPWILSPDNLKSGVTRACRYEPDANPTYLDMARHYDTAVIPRRPRKPRDGAKVESGVQIVEREVLARLRDQTFFSLSELNQALKVLVERVNQRPFQKLECSRRDLFLELDKPALKPLADRPYELADFFQPRVNIDYHVEVLGHYYSVPFGLRGQKVEARVTARMVEVLSGGRRVACHVRDDRKGKHTTEADHMPRAHREHLDWSPSRLIQWAEKIGPNCAAATQRIIESRDHPEQGYRASLGVIRLSKSFSSERVDAACRRALALDVCSYRSIKSILKAGIDRESLPGEEPLRPIFHPTHQNVRGRDYYAKAQDPCPVAANG